MHKSTKLQDGWLSAGRKCDRAVSTFSQGKRKRFRILKAFPTKAAGGKTRYAVPPMNNLTPEMVGRLCPSRQEAIFPLGKWSCADKATNLVIYEVAFIITGRWVAFIRPLLARGCSVGSAAYLKKCISLNARSNIWAQPTYGAWWLRFHLNNRAKCGGSLYIPHKIGI